MAAAGEFMAMKTGAECRDRIRILRPSYALDSPTVCRKVAVAGELRGVEAGVECRDSMDFPTQQYGGWSKVAAAGEFMAVKTGAECRDRIRILSPFYALDSPTVCRKVAAAGELRGVDAGVECRDRIRILSSRSAIRRSLDSICTQSTVRLYFILHVKLREVNLNLEL